MSLLQRRLAILRGQMPRPSNVRRPRHRYQNQNSTRLQIPPIRTASEVWLAGRVVPWHTFNLIGFGLAGFQARHS